MRVWLPKTSLYLLVGVHLKPASVATSLGRLVAPLCGIPLCQAIHCHYSKLSHVKSLQQMVESEEFCDLVNTLVRQ